MPTIKVAKAFGLLLTPTDKPIRFEVGEHEVSDDVAAHWYVREHLEPEPEVEDAPAEVEKKTRGKAKAKAAEQGEDAPAEVDAHDEDAKDEAGDPSEA